MLPTTKVIFYWLDRFGRRREHKTIYSFFKIRAIELLEQEQKDEVRDIYYTIEGENSSFKLDYYNDKL